MINLGAGSGGRAVLLALAVATILPIWRRSFPKDTHMPMDWRDYTLYYFCAGLGMLLAGMTLDWRTVSLAGVILWMPLCVVMIGGMIWRVEQAFRGLKRR